MAIKKLEQLIELVQKNPKKRVVIAYGQDELSILSAKKAIDLNFADFTIIGDESIIKKICKDHDIDHKLFTIINEPDEMKSGKKAMTLLNHGNGDVLMKGLISTDKLLKCIIDKENGLMIPKATLSHISIAEIPNYHKLLIFTDAAFIPRPNIEQKIAMTNYVIKAARRIGVKRPKVSIISFSEKTNPKIPSAVDGAFISKMADRNQIKNADIDGPLSLDLSIDPESLKYKGVKSCVEGNADCLVFPFLEVANVFYKTLTYFAKAKMVTYIVGTKLPVAITSRTDTLTNKLYSLAFSCLMANKDNLEEEE
ncbi:MAG: phosphate acyltransferase [Candidatus Tenebribacter davisii]|nr:phosphate acyltransferase [Candidatus Tenebribacter davisii]